jgi:hypothetical protein
LAIAGAKEAAETIGVVTRHHDPYQPHAQVAEHGEAVTSLIDAGVITGEIEDEVRGQIVGRVAEKVEGVIRVVVRAVGVVIGVVRVIERVAALAGGLRCNGSHTGACLD